MDKVKLVVNGVNLSGWQSVQVHRSLDEACSTFSLSMSSMDVGGLPVEVRANAPCEIWFGNDLVLTGYIDRYADNISIRSHSINVSGRSKTRDIVDCSNQHMGSYQNMNLYQIAVDLCNQQSIDVIKSTDVGDAFINFMPELGEPIFEIIEKLARLRYVIVTDDEKGNLLLTQAGTAGSGKLQRLKKATDNNIIASRRETNATQRYGKIVVMGQGIQNLEVANQLGSSLSSTAVDSTMPANRVLIKVMEYNGTGDDCQKRANWEIAHRSGRSTTFSYSTSDWRMKDGSLFKTNQMVSVYDDYYNIYTDLVIAEITYTLDQGSGTTCELVLMPPEAFTPDPSFKDPALSRWQDVATDTNSGSNTNTSNQ